MKKGIFSCLEIVICGLAFITILAFICLVFWLAAGS
jgi:hypothetical protein